MTFTKFHYLEKVVFQFSFLVFHVTVHSLLQFLSCVRDSILHKILQKDFTLNVLFLFIFKHF